VGWAGQIYPYVKSAGVYKCPDDSTNPSGTAVPISYGYNGLNICRSNTLNNGSTGLDSNTAQFASPAKSVLLFEVSGIVATVTDPTETLATNSGVQMSGIGNGPEYYTNGSVNNFRYQTGQYAYPAGYTPSVIPGLHTSGANFLMADGHVKWLMPAAVSYGDPALKATDPQNISTTSAAGTADSSTPGFAATFSPI